jgi:hypothetical protein
VPSGNIAYDRLDARSAHAHAEELRHHRLDLVRFVEDDRVVVRNGATAVRTAQRQVGKKQVVIDHHDLGVLRLAPHARDEARFVVGAALSDAGVRAALHVGPDGRVLGQPQLGTLAGAGGQTKLTQLGQRAGRGHAFGLGRADELGVAAQTQVIAQALHHGCGDRDAQVAREQRQVAMDDLFLQRLGAGGDDHLLARQQGRHQIRQRLARAGSGLDQRHAVGLEGPLHQLGHG